MNYQKVYNQIIEHARSENRIKSKEIYYEAHHIIPKCLGGEGLTKHWKTHPNIILLTAREHLICHMLLCEIYPNENKLKQALWLMAINKNKKIKYNVSARMYEYIKQNNNKILSETISKKKTNHICYKNPERGKKISKSLKGHKQTFEQIESKRISNSKPILQYDLEGNFIREWPSATEAAKFLKKSNRAINNNLKNICLTSYGYIWKYKK